MTNRQYLKNVDLTVTTIFVILLLAILLMLMLLTSPKAEVLVSNSTGECVKVINYTDDTNYTCDNLPPKYNHIWVK